MTTEAREIDRERLARCLLMTIGDLDRANADGHLAAVEHSGDCTKQAWTCARCYADEHRQGVTAILREMLEPSEGMLDAVFGGGLMGDEGEKKHYRSVYRAMIQHILDETDG